ncbi:unnamed protein product, partial [Ectocarpus sp. 12 AP-2014]
LPNDSRADSKVKNTQAVLYFVLAWPTRTAVYATIDLEREGASISPAARVTGTRTISSFSGPAAYLPYLYG